MTRYDEDVRSVTMWHRLSPTTRDDTMTRGLRAELHDPLWLLGRQWQVGEFAGEDAGSPVTLELWCDHDPMGRVELAPDRDGTSPRDYDPHEDGPLEAMVERETVTTPAGDDQPGREVAAEAGRYFLARLDAELSGGAPAPNTFEGSLLLDPPDDDTDTAGERYLSVMRGRALDGYRLYERLTADGDIAAAEDWTGVSWGAVDLPYPGSGTAPDAYKRAAKAFVDWYADLYDEPASTSDRAWSADRMEYQFRASTGAGDAETVFRADEYAGGRLDRDDFTVETDPAASLAGDGADGSDLPDLDGMAADDGGTPDPSTPPGEGPPPDLSMLPTRVTFPGMSSPRWWEFEDGGVNLANMTVGPGELGKLLVTEFATLYGNDWFSVPLDVPIGSLTRITECRVTDTFGVVESVPPATEHTTATDDGTDHEVGTEATEGSLGGALVGSDGWNAFMHTGLPSHDRPGLLVPPVLAEHHESDPIERVLLARDELANMAFGIELVTEDAVGDPLRWREYSRPELAVDAVSPASDPDDEWVRLVNTGEASLDVAGWSVGTDDGDSYIFGDGSGDPLRLDADETLTLTTGTGTAVGDEYYWGRTDRDGPVWAGADEVTIRDATGDVVANEFIGTPGDVDPGLPDYRLVTDVRDHWFPLRMRAAGAAADGDAAWEIGDLRFELSRLLDADPGIPEPAGEVLEPGLKLYDEELTRAGLAVTRSYQLARWIGGSTHLWSGRRAGIGRGEGSSGLRFDVLQEPDVGDADGSREGGGL